MSKVYVVTRGYYYEAADMMRAAITT